MIRHVVLMRFTDPTDAPEAARRLRALAGLVASARSLEVGLDVGRGPGSYDLALISTHDDRGGLQEYAEDPRHQEVLAWLRPRLSERAVVDTDTDTVPPGPPSR